METAYTLTKDCLGEDGLWKRTYTAVECGSQALGFVERSAVYTSEQKADSAKVIAALITKE